MALSEGLSKEPNPTQAVNHQLMTINIQRMAPPLLSGARVVVSLGTTLGTITITSIIGLRWAQGWQGQLINNQ